MGVVWEAIEHRFDRRVALKVHGRDKCDKDDLFAEAFVAARIGDPSIVRVLDVGFSVDGMPFYTMELVDGTDLGSVLQEGKLAPRRALAIAADIARAAAAAHDHGVVHRDLKPRNVMIDATGRARVLDFGIAFATSETDRYAGSLAGSPGYMAPEQVLGLAIVPQTDIFAIGVMLYEMLIGEHPFDAPSISEVMSSVVTSMPSRLRERDPNLHADLEAVVARCLAKSAADRFTSARVLFETLSAIAEGRAVETERDRATYAPKPITRRTNDLPKREEAKKHFVWKWRLSASPEAVWRYVANTDRFNKAVGVPPVQFTDDVVDGGILERTGEQRVLGLVIRWREFPFEWVRHREHAVFRLYRSGPLAAMWNKVSLLPLEEGGTELRHEIWLTPRGMLGPVASFVEVERKLGPAFDRFYKQLDELLGRDPDADPFDGPHEPTPEQREIVESVAKRLEQEGFPSTIVRKLAEHLLTSPDAVVGTLKPYELADAWRCNRGEVLDVFVHAAHEGLLEPSWDVVCPKCLIAHESHKELSGVTRVGTCRACASTFERDLRDCVELVFAPHPAVRAIERTTYCLGSPALRPHIFIQQVLDPGEERIVSVSLPRGHYRVAGTYATRPWDFVASAVGFETKGVVSSDGRVVTGRPDIVRAGEVTFFLRNESDREETFRVETPGARSEAVSASIALTHPSFRALFSDQMLAQGEHLRVAHLAFVFVTLQDREALYERLGDAAACDVLTKLDGIASNVARAQEGTLVPSSLDLLVLAFPTPTRAIHAALALLDRISQAQLGANVAVACHDGRCIALTREGTAEFFGETLQRGQALLTDAPPDGLILSAAFAADHSVAVALHEAALHLTVRKASEGPYAGRRITLVTRT